MTINFDSLVEDKAEEVKDANIQLKVLEAMGIDITDAETAAESIKAMVAAVVPKEEPKVEEPKAEEPKVEEIDFEELAIGITQAEMALDTIFKSIDQESDIKSIRKSLMEVTLEEDMSLLNHYRESFEGIGIDCTSAKTAAESITSLIEKFEERQFNTFVEANEMEVSTEDAVVVLLVAYYVVMLAAIAYTISVIMSVEGRVNKLKQIIDKGLLAEPKKRDKKFNMVPANVYERIVPNTAKALDFMFANINDFADDKAKQVKAMMEKAGAVWNGKNYVATDWGIYSSLTVEQGKWTPEAVKKATAELEGILKVMIKAKNIEKQVKEAAKKANKEDGGGFFKKSDRAKEIKANRVLAGKTLRQCATIALNVSRMLVPIAKQYEK